MIRSRMGRIPNTVMRQRGLVRAAYTDPLVTNNTSRAGLGPYFDTAGFFNVANNNVPRRTNTDYVTTNLVPNPRFENFSAGIPANMGVYLAPAGMNYTLTRGTLADGTDYLDWRVFGTPANPNITGELSLYWAAASSLPVNAGETYNLSASVSLVAGSWANTNFGTVRMIYNNAAFGYIGEGSKNFEGSGGPIVTSPQTRTNFPATLPANTAYILPMMSLWPTGTGPIDITLRLIAPVLEAGNTNKGIPLPPRGQPGQSILWSGNRLLVENARTNYVRNPRLEGGTSGVLGSGGVLPTGVNYTFNGVTGVTATYTKIAMGGQYSILRLQLTGTPVGSAVFALFFEQVGLTGMALSDPSVFAYYARRVAGSFTNTGLVSWGPIYDSTPTIVVDNQPNETANVTTYFKRFHSRSDAPGTGTAPFSRPTVGPLILMNNGLPMDITLDFMLPQLANAAYPLTMGVPPVGTPGIATRPQDVINIPAAGWYISGKPFSFIITAKRSVAATDPFNGLFGFDDVSFNNRLYCYCDTATGLWIASAVGGTYTGPYMLGNITLDVQFKLVVAVDGTNIRMSLNGGAVATMPYPVALSVINTLSIGSLGAVAAVGNSWNGEIGQFDYVPYAMTDAQMRQAST